jgi:hypothetical protein
MAAVQLTPKARKVSRAAKAKARCSAISVPIS